MLKGFSTLSTVLLAFTSAAAFSYTYVPCYDNTLNERNGRDCSCYVNNNKELVANCSYGRLRWTPNLRDDIIVLNLTGNRISRLRNGTFSRYKLLRELDLSSNKISFIEMKGFEGLIELDYLNLFNNKLPLTNKIYPPDIFRPLQNLRSLHINRNIDPSSTMDPEYPSDALGLLPSLTELYIDGIVNRTFSTPLRTLRSLHMNGRTDLTDGYCSIYNITDDYFTNLPNLRNLEMRGCDVRNIGIAAFEKLSLLRRLDLSDNYYLGYQKVENALRGLQKHRTLHELYLNAIQERIGVGTVLPVDFVQLLSRMSVQKLGLESNRLEIIAENAISRYPPKSLQHLFMRNNRLMYGPYVNEVRYLTNLLTIDLSYMGNSWNRQVRDSDFLSASIPSRHVSASQMKGSYIVLPKSLTTASFYRSNVRTTISAMYFDPKNSLQTLNLRSSILYNWTGPIQGLDNLLHLDLSHNFCSVISNSFFNHLTSVQNLSLSGNRLYPLESDTNGMILGNLSELRYLNLSLNMLRDLPQGVFQHLTNLEELDLTYNSFTIWNVNITTLSKLHTVILSHNMIRRLNQTSRQEFDRRAVSNDFELHLYGNKFDCACYNLDFIEWLSTTKVHLTLFDKYVCLFDDAPRNVTFHDIEYFRKNILARLNSYCQRVKYLPYVISGTGVFTLIVLTVSVVVIYRYRWKFRYMYYLSRARYRGYSTLDETFEFDAFVSYADEDRMFVKCDMVEKLEEEAGLKLCIHHREFIPGLPIEENIASGVHRSRHFIVLLTKHFIASHWCMYEFNMARMEDLYNSRDKLIVIMDYKPIPDNLLPAGIREVRELHTYATYPEGDRDDTNFWRKVITAIKL